MLVTEKELLKIIAPTEVKSVGDVAVKDGLKL